MSKTGKPKCVKIAPSASRILDEYRTSESQPGDFVFPLLRNDRDYSDRAFEQRKISSQNSLVNGNLKKLAEMADIKINLSFHVSRCSFADYARQQGLGVYDISKALGDASIKTTETYLKGFDRNAVDEAIDTLFG